MGKNAYKIANLSIAKSKTRSGYWYKDEDGNTGYISNFMGKILLFLK